MLMGEYIRQVHPVSFAQSSEAQAAGVSSDPFSETQGADTTITDRPHFDIERATEIPIKAPSLRYGQALARAKGRPVEADLIPSGSLASRDSSDPHGLVNEVMDVPKDIRLTPPNEISSCAPTSEGTPTPPREDDSPLLNIEFECTSSEPIPSSKPAASEPLIYAKDLTCPNTWREYLQGFLPNWLVYMAGNDLMSKPSIALSYCFMFCCLTLYYSECATAFACRQRQSHICSRKPDGLHWTSRDLVSAKASHTAFLCPIQNAFAYSNGLLTLGLPHILTNVELLATISWHGLMMVSCIGSHELPIA